MSLAKTEPVRLWLYPVALAVVGILVYRGVVTGDEAPLWLALAAAVLNVGGIEASRRLVTSPATLARDYQPQHRAG